MISDFEYFITKNKDIWDSLLVVKHLSQQTRNSEIKQKSDVDTKLQFLFIFN